MPAASTPLSAPVGAMPIDRFLPGDADAQQEKTGFSIGIADLRVMAWRQRYILLAVVAAALILALVATFLMTPIYEAKSTVRIDQEGARIMPEGQDVDPAISLSDAGRYLNTQRSVIMSRAMAYRVVDGLKLAENDDFLIAMGAGPVPEALPPAQKTAARREAAAGLLQENLTATVPVDSRIATISFRSPDPAVAARVANAYAEKYINSNITRRFESTAYARTFLQSEIERAQDRLEQAERAAIAYAQQAQLIDAGDAASPADGGEKGGSSGSSRSLTTANLVRLNSDYAAARSARIAAEQRWAMAQRAQALELPEVIANSAVQNLRADRARLQGQLLQLRQRYTGEHPQVAELGAQIASLDRQILQIANQTRNAIRNEYVAARSQEEMLRNALGGLRDEALDEQRRRVQLNLISRGAETLREQLDQLLQRHNQVRAAAEITANNVSLLDSAEPPRAPVSPRPLFNLAAALAAGLALALVLAFIREALDDTVRSPEDVERKLRLPLIGTTPTVVGALPVHALTDSKHALSEAYYSARAALDFASPTGAPRSLLVTSSAPAEGKTTTAVALALDYARIGKRALLVDGDLRKPSLHKLFELPNTAGFVNVLTGQNQLADVIQPIPDSSLHVVTLGPIPPNPAQLLSSQAVSNFLARYRDEYDIIVLDAAPVMGIADSPLISSHVEGTLMIIEANRAHRGQAKAALRRLNAAHARLLGIILTKFDPRDAGYHYDYHYKYYSYGSKDGNEGSRARHVKEDNVG